MFIIKVISLSKIKPHKISEFKFPTVRLIAGKKRTIRTYTA